MDRISGEVRFAFGLNRDRRPEPDLLASRILKVIADIEGLLEISTNGHVVFREEGVLLMELGLDLAKWLGDIRTSDCLVDFEYVSIDYAEGALLGFVHAGDHRWQLQSPWIVETILTPVQIGHSTVAV